MGFIVSLILLVIFISVIVMGHFLAHKIVHPEIKSYATAKLLTNELGEINVEEMETLSQEELHISSQYGYQLYGKLFHTSQQPKGIVILVHGITWNSIGSYKYIKLFLKRGYHVVVYDHRNHGKSGGTFTSFGYYEKEDLKSWIQYVKNRFGVNSVIGLHGESMGAATALQYVAKYNDVQFLISDSAFSNLECLIRYRLREDYKITFRPIIPFINLYIQIRYGWTFINASPIQKLCQIQIPVLFIHGERDTYVPSWMCQELYNKKKGEKQKYIAKKATHAKSFTVDHEQYEQVVHGFLAQYHF